MGIKGIQIHLLALLIFSALPFNQGYAAAPEGKRDEQVASQGDDETATNLRADLRILAAEQNAVIRRAVAAKEKLRTATREVSSRLGDKKICDLRTMQAAITNLPKAIQKSDEEIDRDSVSMAQFDDNAVSLLEHLAGKSILGSWAHEGTITNPELWNELSSTKLQYALSGDYEQSRAIPKDLSKRVTSLRENGTAKENVWAQAAGELYTESEKDLAKYEQKPANLVKRIEILKTLADLYGKIGTQAKHHMDLVKKRDDLKAYLAQLTQSNACEQAEAVNKDLEEAVDVNREIQHEIEQKLKELGRYSGETAQPDHLDKFISNSGDDTMDTKEPVQAFSPR